MDITTRKYKFIEQFMKIVSVEKLERFEQLLRKEIPQKKEIVAYTIQGEPLTKEEYIRLIKEADKSINSGDFITVEDLEKEVQNW